MTLGCHQPARLGSGAEDSLRLHLDLLAGAQSTVTSLCNVPVFVPPCSAVLQAEERARERGVRFRRLLSPAAGWREAALDFTQAGDEVRMRDAVPFQLMLVDDREVLMPLPDDHAPGHARALALGNVAATQAVVAVVEQLWACAAPATPHRRLSAEPRWGSRQDMIQLVRVLSAGINDKLAAHMLDISERTLQRRVAALQARLRARSRFQAGWLAARLLDR